jgi:hypothetical protein
MRTRQLITWGSLVALAAIGIALFQRHRRQAAESLAAAYALRAELANAELQKIAARRAELDQARERLRRHLDQVQRDGPATAPNANLKSQDPALLRQAIVRAHAAAALRYRALFQSLHLAPAQEQQLKGIVEDYELRARDIWEEGNAAGISTTDPALWQLMQPDYEKMRAAVTALVGEAGFQQVDEYNRSLVAHDFSTALASSLYYTDTPLTPQQATALVGAFANLSPGYQQGHSAIDLYTMDWTSSYPQLATVLSPPQLAALKTVVDARQAYVKLSPLVGASVGYVVNAAAQKPPGSGR